MSRTVLDKLGFKAGMTGWAHAMPAELTSLLPLPEPQPDAAPDLLLAFVLRQADVEPALAAALQRYVRGARLWFCYPKTAGAIAADINRDKGWEPVEAAGLLPVSQVAIDATWSALRFRLRDEIRLLTRASERA